MNLEEFLKYVLWIAFFSLALFGIYNLLKLTGVM